MSRLLLVALALLAGCDDGGGASAPTDAAPVADAAAVEDAAAPDAGVAGAELLPRLAGLWSGPASETPLGAFPVLNMDVRPADDRQLFSRFDLDAENNLRFAFDVEDVGGRPTLVYRNGGYFLGILRDTRTVLVAASADAWRFCHPERGCEYLDATFTFDGADRLTLVVLVRGMMHLRWPARRLETRDVGGFDPTVGPADDPFPPMPALQVHATWRGALDAPHRVWLLLSTTPCGFTGACNPARVLSFEAPAGATEATLLLDQVHAGRYHLNVILDRNDDFTERLFPNSGDSLSGLDVAVDVAPEGTTAVDRRLDNTVP
ncbi:MAG: hypothetical protein H6706_25500 [Myxococcales bacterium]|nr:hypothetical protein [Myxococcales bacterium]